MLTEKDLEKQDTFFKSKRGNWFSHGWDYMIAFEGHRTVLYSHCEVEGDTEELKTLNNLKDLKQSYELLTGDEFE
jgi:hypothetical protein